jgi:hypothetical protein
MLQKKVGAESLRRRCFAFWLGSFRLPTGITDATVRVQIAMFEMRIRVVGGPTEGPGDVLA